jgi:hypothetical protein
MLPPTKWSALLEEGSKSPKGENEWQIARLAATKKKGGASFWSVFL